MNNLIKKIKNNWKDLLLIVLVVALLGTFFVQNNNLNSLNFKSYDMAESQMAGGSYRTSSYYPQQDFAPEIEERKVIKNANLNLETNYYDGAVAQVKNSVNAHNIITLNENEYKYKEDYRRISYTFKVNSDKLDIFVNELKTYGEVENINIYSNDVTGTYVDFSDRLERYKLQIEKYEVMLERDNLEVKDEIQIQTRIDQLEDSIFYFEDRVNSIDENVNYSTVNLQVKEKPSLWSEIDFLGLKDGFKMFMESLESGVQFILMLFGFVIPFCLIYGIYRLIKRFF